jgi:hypothetical protein
MLHRAFLQLGEFAERCNDAGQFHMVQQKWHFALQPLFTKLHGHVNQLFEEQFQFFGSDRRAHFEAICGFLVGLAQYASVPQRHQILAEIG